MNGLLSLISESTVTALSVALIASISTLLGVYITNKSNDKKLWTEYAFRERQEQKKLLIEKRESLFMTMEDIDHIYFKIFRAIRPNKPFDLTKANFANYFRDDLTRIHDHKKKLKMLVSLYFPHLANEIEQHYEVLKPLHIHLSDTVNEDVDLVKDFSDIFDKYLKNRQKVRESVSEVD